MTYRAKTKLGRMASSERFSELNEDELQLLLDARDSQNTKRMVKASVAVLKLYLESKGTEIK